MNRRRSPMPVKPRSSAGIMPDAPTASAPVRSTTRYATVATTAILASATGAPQDTTASAVSRTATGATSGESAAWPCFRASSRRRGVARSVRSPASGMGESHESADEAGERRLEVGEAGCEQPDGERQRGTEHEEADADVHRKADDEHVELRDRAGEHAERAVGEEEDDQDRRGDARAEHEDVARQTDGAGHARRREADAARCGRPEALEERADQQVVYVEHEEDQQRQQLLPLGDDRHLAVRLRVDQVGDAEPHLDAGELAAELHAREDELRDEAEEDAERRLRGEH